MKRLFSVFISIGLLACMSLNSLAAMDLTKPFYDNAGYLVDQGDGNTYFGVLDTKSLSESDKDWLRDFFAVMTGEKTSSSAYGVFCFVNYEGGSVLYFAKHPSGFKAIYNSDYIFVAGSVTPAPDYLKFTYSSSSGIFAPSALKLKGTLTLNHKNTISNLYPPSSAVPNHLAGSLLWSNKTMTFEGVPSTALQSTYSGSLGFIDNDGLLSPEEPEEPSSSEPPTSSEMPTIPDVPKIESEYIPYDTSLWNGFRATVLDYVQRAAKVGLFIFAILLGLWAIKRVVKIFLH